MNIIITTWNKIPAPAQKWLQGAEVAVLTGLSAAAVSLLTGADFTTKAGITRFAVEVVGTAGACLRLYMAQSPIQKVMSASLAVESKPDGSSTAVLTQTTAPVDALPSAQGTTASK